MLNLPFSVTCLICRLLRFPCINKEPDFFSINEVCKLLEVLKSCYLYMLAQSNESISECDLYSGLHGVQKESLEHLGKQLIQFYHLSVAGFPWKKKSVFCHSLISYTTKECRGKLEAWLCMPFLVLKFSGLLNEIKHLQQ